MVATVGHKGFCQVVTLPTLGRIAPSLDVANHVGCRTEKPVDNVPVVAPAFGAFLMSHNQAVCASGEVQRHEGGLRLLAPRLDSNSKQDRQTDEYEKSDRIQVDPGCGELPN
jgi:hypothetical protein